MSRRDGYPRSKWFKQPGSAYARSAGWPTRYYKRKTTGTVVASLAGLNTTADDFAKKDGESPYLYNARLNGTKEKHKRAQSMSRMGQEFVIMPEGLEQVVDYNYNYYSKNQVSRINSIECDQDASFDSGIFYEYIMLTYSNYIDDRINAVDFNWNHATHKAFFRFKKDSRIVFERVFDNFALFYVVCKKHGIFFETFATSMAYENNDINGSIGFNFANTKEIYSAIEISEKKSIRWPVNVNSRITRVGLKFILDDPGDSNAHFVLILRSKAGKELCRAIKKVSDIYDDITSVQWFRFIKTAPAEGCILEATLVDDFDPEGNQSDTKISIVSSADEPHEYSVHDLPNLSESLREKPYTWENGICRPIIAYATCDYKTFPVWMQRGYFNSGSYRYNLLGVEDANGNKCVYAIRYARFNKDTGQLVTFEDEGSILSCELIIPNGNINTNARQVRCAQAGNFLYFVDGYSPLQKVQLDSNAWNIANAVPDATDVDTFGYAGNMYYYTNAVIVDGQKFWRCKEDHQGGDSFDATEKAHWTEESLSSITAWEGASLIYFHNNRLILSGFRNATVGESGSQKAEPNLVIMSSITAVKPCYDIFNKSIEFFYVPDMAQSQSSAAPVTAFASIGDYLLIFTSDGLVIETIESAVEFAGISQSVPEGSQYGVMKQEHVSDGTNVVYFYNRTMGVMRTAGSTATLMSEPVDVEMENIDDRALDKLVLCMTKDTLRLYYDREGRENNMSLVDYATIPQHKSYWFRDNNTPVSSISMDKGTDLTFATHSQYPCVFLVDSSLKDFDCAILYEYYTKYLGTPDRLDHTIVRRIHLTTLQTYHSSIYIGLDYDHNNKPIVWRRFITPVEEGTFENEDIFGDDGESGATNIDIRTLTTDTRFVQLRMKQYCYDFQAEIMQIGFEYANRTTL